MLFGFSRSFSSPDRGAYTLAHPPPPRGLGLGSSTGGGHVGLLGLVDVGGRLVLFIALAGHHFLMQPGPGYAPTAFSHICHDLRRPFVGSPVRFCSRSGLI